MKNQIKKLLLLITAIVALTVCLAFGASAGAEYSDTEMVYTDELSWNLENGVLTISGEGYMRDYASWIYGNDYLPPWYNDRGSIYSVVVQEGVTWIGCYAFYDCYNLTTVELPSTITQIRDYSFGSCERLTTINIPDGTEILTYNSFADCESLEEIKLPDSLTKIGYGTFERCTSLKYVEMSENIEEIGYWAFAYTALEEIDWTTNKLELINHCSFAYCYSLKSVSFSNIETIGSYAFTECLALESIAVEEGLKEIDNGAFENCTALTKIKVPDGVEKIGGEVLNGTAYYNNSFNWEDDMLYLDTYLISVADTVSSNCSVKEGTTVIASWTFDTHEELVTVTLPDSVTSIGDYAFRSCTSLESIVIPDSVTSIGYRAFSFCTSLSTVYYTGTEEQWNNIAIEDYNDCLTNASIHFNHICIDENSNSLCDECEEDTSDVYVDEKFYVAFEGKEVYYSFIPTVTGNYTIKSLDDQFDPYCTLYDENMNCLAYDDDSDMDRNFEITHYYEKGKTYKFSFKSYDFGKYPVIVTYNDEIEEPSTESNTNPHTHAYTSTTKSPTCTATGTTTYTCSCGDTYTETVKAKGHTVVIDKAVAATCTKTGLSAVSHCSECNAVITKQNTVAKKAHTSDKGTVTKKATYTSTGTKTYKCTVCKTTLKTEKIARLNLSKVSGLKASSIKTTSIKFTWNKVTGAEKYEIYYSTNGKKWTKVTTSKNSITVKKLKAGKTYKVKVRAVAGDNTGAYSSVLTTSTKPSKVTLNKLTAGKKKLTAQWKTISGVTGYEVTYSTSKKFTKKTTKTVTIKKAKTKKTTLKKLKSGKKYYVKVRAYKTVNGKKIYGAYSAVKTVKVK